jgi:putative phosphoesterase
MRIAVVSDVHGNMVAFDAVLQDIQQEAIDRIVALGDMIQSGPKPAEVAQRLRDLNCPVVIGNSDAWLLTGAETGNEKIPEERLKKLQIVREWSLARLHKADRDFIASFTPTIQLDLQHGYKFLGFHGSPTDFDQLIFPHTPEAEFQGLLSPYADHILAGGHVHLPYVRRISNSFFFNPGSVGVAYNHEQDEAAFHLDPWAEYAILTVNETRLGLEFRRVSFDVDELARIYRESGRPFAEEVIAEYKANP